MKRYSLLILAALGCFVQLIAQSTAPTVSFYSQKDEANVELNAGDESITQAPVDITCTANIDDNGGQYRYVCEWRIYRSDEGEDSPVLTRFDEEVTYTLTQAGGYGIKLYTTFVDDSKNDTVEIVSDEIKVVVSESKLICPDGFSPNDDQINDVYTVEYESLVKVSGVIVNRWGKKMHTFTLENLADGWDGKQGGEPVKDGVYFLNLDAVGSDGLHYRIKKAINVLKGTKEVESSGADG